eukprot:1846158-Pleurochrysis_carterae.AAC.2
MGTLATSRSRHSSAVPVHGGGGGGGGSDGGGGGGGGFCSFAIWWLRSIWRVIRTISSSAALGVTRSTSAEASFHAASALAEVEAEAPLALRSTLPTPC